MMELSTHRQFFFENYLVHRGEMLRSVALLVLLATTTGARVVSANEISIMDRHLGFGWLHFLLFALRTYAGELLDILARTLVLDGTRDGRRDTRVKRRDLEK